MKHTLNRTQEVASKGFSASATLQHLYPTGNQTFRAIVSLSSASVKQEEFNEAVGSALGYKARVVEESSALVSEFGNLFSCFVVANTISRPYSEAANFKLLAANMFVDDEKNIWKVVGDGDERRLIQTSNDNLEEILQARLSKKIVTASFNAGGDIGTGDYAVFFNSRTQNIEAGFAVVTEEGPFVFSRQTEKLEKVNYRSIIEAAVGSDVKEQPFEVKYLETAITKDALNKYLEYMSRLYKGTEYFVQLEKNIKTRYGLGEKDLFKPTLKA